MKKVKSTKSKSAAKKAKAPSPAKKAKGKSSDKKAKASKPTKPVKKAVSKAVSKPTKKSSTVKKSAKPVKPVKKKTAKPEPKKASKKAVKPAKPAAKAAKPVKPAKPAKASKPVKATKSAKPEKPLKAVKPANPEKVAPAKPAKPIKAVEKAEKVKPTKEKAGSKKSKKGNGDEDELGDSEDFNGFDEEPPVKAKKGKGGRKPKSNDDDEPEIIHDDLIEQIIQTTKKQNKGPKKPRILQTFVNPINSLSLAQSEGGKKGGAKKEPKGKFELEYVVRTSPGILYELLTTPSGLSEWFADDVNIRDGVFTFFWDGSEQKAKLIGFKEEKYVRLQWLDKPDGTYFEFRIERDELTGDISLMIVDFAEESSDQQTSKLLWDSQVNKLLNVLGSN